MTSKPQQSPDANEARPKVVVFIILAGLAVMLVPFVLSHRSAQPTPGENAATEEQAQPVDNTRPVLPVDSRSHTPRTVEDQWGVQISGVRLALGGNGLDLRYKVIDPGKATNLLSLQWKPVVIDQVTGKVLEVPFQRENQTSQKLVAGKTYFALLPNKGQVVKSGSKVTVAIGNTRQRDIVVE